MVSLDSFLKHKIEVDISMEDEKMRAEVIKIVAGVGGVINSVALGGNNRDKLVVVGIGIDPVKLTRRLRKQMGFERSFTLKGLVGKRSGSVKLVLVEPVKDKDEKKKPDTKPGELPPASSCCGTNTVQLLEVGEPRWGLCGLY
ncbi:unnamed protein product [Spirodela intermedia]|uniref:Uncharacterized protein n=1 Tax=Spirodela intermedia TaxID=51605 RepID=A0A7I8LHU8_SPIIN|nr:unnamed protein product [Spirodela intermedia]